MGYKSKHLYELCHADEPDLGAVKVSPQQVFYLKTAAPDQEFLRHASSNRQLKAEDMFKASDEVTAFEEDDELFSPAARFSTA